MSENNSPDQSGRNTSYYLIAYLLAALTMALWAGNWVIGRSFRTDIPPITLAFLRWGTALIALAPFAWGGAMRDFSVARKDWKRLLGLGASGAAIFHSLVYTGLRSTEAINGVLLNSMGPIIIILMAWVFVGDTITRRQAFGIAVSLIGTIFLVSRGEIANLLALKFNIGDIWILIAIFFWGIYSLLLRNRPKGISGRSLLFYTSAAAVLFLVPGVLVEYWLGYRVSISLPIIAGIGYIGIFATVLAFTCYNTAVARIGPGQTGIIIYLLPIFGAIAAVIFLDEALQTYHLIGFTIILSGILLSTWKISR